MDTQTNEWTGTDTGVIKVMQAYDKSTQRMVDYYADVWKASKVDERI